MLRQCQLRKGERFRYVYDYYVYWVCDIRLEVMLPVEPKRVYPVCTGGQHSSPSENFQDVQAYMEHRDQHRYNLPVEAMLVMADARKVIVETDSNAPVRRSSAIERLCAKHHSQSKTLMRLSLRGSADVR